MMLDKKLEAYQNILNNLKKEEAQNQVIHKDILKVLESPLYNGDEDALLESVIKIELIAQIEPPKSNQALKQKLLVF